MENVKYSEMQHGAELPRLVEIQANESLRHLCTLFCA